MMLGIPNRSPVLQRLHMPRTIDERLLNCTPLPSTPLRPDGSPTGQRGEAADGPGRPRRYPATAIIAVMVQGTNNRNAPRALAGMAAMACRYAAAGSAAKWS